LPLSPPFPIFEPFHPLFLELTWIHNQLDVRGNLGNQVLVLFVLLVFLRLVRFRYRTKKQQTVRGRFVERKSVAAYFVKNFHQASY